MKKNIPIFKLFVLLALLLSLQSSVAQCTASFSYTPGSNGTYTLMSTSTTSTSFSSYFWNFGNGSTLTTVSPSVAVTYTINGSYPVMLTALGSCSAAAMQTIVVSSVIPPCNLTASFTPSSSYYGLITFTPVSSATTSTTYTFFYGDSDTGTVAYHQYSLTNVYTPTLIAMNGSCQAIYSHSVAVDICAPAVIPGYSYAINPAGNVTFTNISQNTNTTTIYNLTATGPGQGPSTVTTIFSGVNFTTASVTFTNNGNYVISLTLSNTAAPSCTYSPQTNSIVISNICNVAANYTYSANGNGHISFANLTTGTVSGTTYSLNYGDGGSSTSLSPHTYSAGGTYTSYLIATNPGSVSCTSTIAVIINVPVFCNVQFTYNVIAAGTTTFICQSAPVSTTAAYYWNFGNGYTVAVGNTNTTAVTYTANGNYHVLLTFNDGFCIATDSANILITNVGLPCSLSPYFTHTVSSNGFVTFASSSTGTTSASRYTWNFGDGFTSSGNPVSHTYSGSSGYVVKLVINDTIYSCMDSISESVNVTGLLCQANSSFILTHAGAAQEWNATPANPWNVTAATWNWGDGTQSNTLYTSHTYSAVGNYNVCLSVTVSCGNYASSCSYSSLYRSAEANETTTAVKINVTAPSTTVTGIAAVEAGNEAFTIYPNPNTGEFNLMTGTVNAGKLKVTVYTSVGTTVYNKDIQSNDDQIKLNLTGLPAGVYFIQVHADDKIYTKKFIISNR